MATKTQIPDTKTTALHSEIDNYIQNDPYPHNQHEQPSPATTLGPSHPPSPNPTPSPQSHCDARPVQSDTPNQNLRIPNNKMHSQTPQHCPTPTAPTAPAAGAGAGLPATTPLAATSIPRKTTADTGNPVLEAFQARHRLLQPQRDNKLARVTTKREAFFTNVKALVAAVLEMGPTAAGATSSPTAGNNAVDRDGRRGNGVTGVAMGMTMPVSPILLSHLRRLFLPSSSVSPDSTGLDTDKEAPPQTKQTAGSAGKWVFHNLRTMLDEHLSLRETPGVVYLHNDMQRGESREYWNPDRLYLSRFRKIHQLKKQAASSPTSLVSTRPFFPDTTSQPLTPDSASGTHTNSSAVSGSGASTNTATSSLRGEAKSVHQTDFDGDDGDSEKEEEEEDEDEDVEEEEFHALNPTQKTWIDYFYIRDILLRDIISTAHECRAGVLDLFSLISQYEEVQSQSRDQSQPQAQSQSSQSYDGVPPSPQAPQLHTFASPRTLTGSPDHTAAADLTNGNTATTQQEEEAKQAFKQPQPLEKAKAAQATPQQSPNQEALTQEIHQLLTDILTTTTTTLSPSVAKLQKLESLILDTTSPDSLWRNPFTGRPERDGTSWFPAAPVPPRPCTSLSDGPNAFVAPGTNLLQNNTDVSLPPSRAVCHLSCASGHSPHSPIPSQTRVPTPPGPTPPTPAEANFLAGIETLFQRYRLLASVVEDPGQQHYWLGSGGWDIYLSLEEVLETFSGEIRKGEGGGRNGTGKGKGQGKGKGGGVGTSNARQGYYCPGLRVEWEGKEMRPGKRNWM